METFTKQSLEAYPISTEYTGRLPTGSSVVSATVSAINTSTGLDATTEVLDSAIATISGTQAQIFVKDGVHGYDYKLSIIALLTPGSPIPTLEDDILMEIRDL